MSAPLSLQRCDELVDLGGGMLPVAVDLDRDVEVALLGGHVPGLHGAADAEVERQRDHARAGVHRLSRSAVARAVVDHHDVDR